MLLVRSLSVAIRGMTDAMLAIILRRRLSMDCIIPAEFERAGKTKAHDLAGMDWCG